MASYLGAAMSSYLSASADYSLMQHDSMTKSLVICNLVSLSFVSVFIAMRLYTRWKRKILGWDDYLALAAGLSALLFSGSCIYGTQHGLGKHIWDIDPKTLVPSTMHISLPLFICYVSYVAAAGFIKCSILMSYRRIFPGLTFRKIITALIIMVVVSAISSIAVIIFSCMPAQSSWDWSAPRDKCINFFHFFIASSMISTALDIVIWSCPLSAFLRLQVNRRRKINLLLLFGVGAFAWVAAIARISQLEGLQSIDITYSGVLSFNWSVAEITIAIACASTPALKPLVADFLPRSWRSASSTSDRPAKVRSTDKASDSSSETGPLRYYGGNFQLQDLEGWSSRVHDTSMSPGIPERDPRNAALGEI